MKRIYRWRCNCGEIEGTEKSVSQAKKKAKDHVKIHKWPTKCFIEEYDDKGEYMSRDWKITNQ